MNPYIYVREATNDGESLLSLCCGIGLELSSLNTTDITAVDIAPQYLKEVKHRAKAKTIQSDATEYILQQPDKSVDVISFLDGVEHMTKEKGLITLEECKRVARKKILVFTPEGQSPDGYLKNEPHNAWGIEGADEHQKHLSGWTREEMKKLGFQILEERDEISQHGEPYKAVMYICIPS